MSRLLIVEDDNDINNLIREAFKKEHYLCTQAFSGTEAVLRMQIEAFDLILLDLMLPGMDGLTVLKNLRKNSDVPVIVISAKDGLDSKVDLLKSGADDYMTKPFEIEELLARAAAQLRRRAGGSREPGVLCFKELEVDKSTYRVLLKGQHITMTRQEFKILEMLLSFPNRVFSKQDIYEYAWDDHYMGEDNTINVHVSNIRSKLKKITEEEYIETVWGIGFKLAEL